MSDEANINKRRVYNIIHMIDNDCIAICRSMAFCYRKLG